MQFTGSLLLSATEKTKYIFFLEADLSTQDKRMKSALASIPLFMAEMEQIFYLSNLSETYRFIQNNIVAIKWAMVRQSGNY